MGILDTETDPQPGFRRCRRAPIPSRRLGALAERGRGVLSTTSGPVVVAAVFCLVFLLMGTAFSFSTFAPELQRELDAGSGAISSIFGCAMALLYAGGAFSGMLADRIGTHRVVGTGALLAGGSLVAGGMVRTVWQADIALGLGFGLGLAVAYSPAVAAVQPWFNRNRGVASGIALSGTGLGTLSMPLVAAWLIDMRGWRTALAVIGLGVMGLGWMAANWIRRPSASPGVSLPHQAHASLRRIACTPSFRWLYIGGFLSSFALLVPMVQTIPHAIRGGSAPQEATWLISILGFGSVVGRLMLGPVADRLGRQRTLGALYGALGMLFITWIGRTSFAAMALFALAYGICYGASIALRPAVIADHFSGPALGAATGLHYTSSALGMLFGPAAFGYAVDWWNSDLVPVCAAAASLLGAGYFFFAAPPPPRCGRLRRRRQAAADAQ
jgi:OFA family oxalate/formate antiporter-like MFS transporter